MEGTAAGGGYSTVGDVARFADALTSHELLSPDSTELLLAGKIDLGYGFKYAFGFFDGRDETGNGFVGHGGGAPGMNGDLRIYPGRGTWSRCWRTSIHRPPADLGLPRPAASDLGGLVVLRAL